MVKHIYHAVLFRIITIVTQRIHNLVDVSAQHSRHSVHLIEFKAKNWSTARRNSGCVRNQKNEDESNQVSYR